MQVAVEHSEKVQELENVIEKEKINYHESRLEIAEFEEKLTNLKHENLLLSSKIEEMNFNEIELHEKVKKLQEDYEGQMGDLSASQQETRNKLKDKCRNLSKELTVSNNKIIELEAQIEEQENTLIEKQKIIDNIQCKYFYYEILDLEADLANAQAEISENKQKITELETNLKQKAKIVNQQKGMINKLACEKDDLALELERQEKMFDVSLNEKNSKIQHLQIMIDKYKKVIDKADDKLKKLPQEFALELMTVKKKVKREKQGMR